MRTLISIFILCISINFCYAEQEPSFDARLVPSIADKQLDFWFFTPENCGPKIPTVKKVYQNQIFMLLMFAKALPIDSQTQLDISFDIKITSPKNTVSIDEKNLPFYKGEIANKLIIPREVQEIGFDQNDIFGVYNIEAVFHERVSNRSYTAKTTVELVPFERPEKFSSKEEIGKWVMQYYQKPNPIKAFAGILEMEQTDPNWIKENYMTLAFYRCIFLDNPFLWEYYTQMYQTASTDEKKKMLLAAAVVPSKEKEQIFVPKIGQELIPLYQEFSKIHIPETDKEITTAEQLDILWSEFFASGRYQPILKIVKALELQKYEKILQKLKNKEIKLTKELELKLMLGIVYQSAVWSLTSNCLNCSLVHQYCQTIFEHEPLSPEVKKSLASVLPAVDYKQKEEQEKTVKQEK
jgi:hypothetical protein